MAARPLEPAAVYGVAPQNEPGREYVSSGDDGRLVELDLHAIYSAIRRNVLWIALIMAAFIGLGIVVTLLTVPQYVATSSVLVEQEAEKIIEENTAPVGYQDAERFLRTQADIIGSVALATRVVESEGLAEDANFFAALGAEFPTQDNVDAVDLGPEGLPGLRRSLATDLLLENLEVSLPNQSRLIGISFSSSSPSLSASISNAVASNYLESNLARKFDSSAYAREFLAQQLNDARDKVEKSERDLNQYSRAAGLIRISGQGQNADKETTLSVTNDALVQLNAASTAATAERIAAERRWQNVSGIAPLSIPEVLGNPAVQQLLTERAKVTASLAEERVKYLDEHPNVQAIQAQLRDVDAQIATLGQSIKRTIRLDYETAREREGSIQGKLASTRGEALDEQDRGVQYNLLKRVAETDRALYNTLLTRFNELSATAGAASNNVSVVDLAEAPREPDSPKPLLNMLLALLGGMVFSGLFVAGRELLDDTVRTPTDVEEKIGLPLLGMIPMAEGEFIEEDLDDPKSGASEAYQSLVTNLRYYSAEGIPKTILVTSSQQGEGKSTTSLQLAREFAKLNKRTLLIDADLRRPTLHRRLPGRREVDGFTSVLAGEKTPAEVIVKSDRENLDFMTALPIPPAPSALLATADIKGLIERLGEHYDHIIFDAPPVLGLSDAPSMAAQIHSAILVVDSTSGKRGGVNSALGRLAMVNSRPMGAVLTKFDPRQAGSAYSYYGSGYYSYEHSSSD